MSFSNGFLTSTLWQLDTESILTALPYPFTSVHPTNTDKRNGQAIPTQTTGIQREAFYKGDFIRKLSESKKSNQKPVSDTLTVISTTAELQLLLTVILQPQRTPPPIDTISVGSRAQSAKRTEIFDDQPPGFLLHKSSFLLFKSILCFTPKAPNLHLLFSLHHYKRKSSMFI